MAINTSEWDPADYLANEEDMIAYVEAAFEDGDWKVVLAVLDDVSRAIERLLAR